MIIDLISCFICLSGNAPPPSTASASKVPEAESLPSAGEEGEGPAPPSLSLDEMLGGTMETDQPQHSITFMEDDPSLKVSEGVSCHGDPVAHPPHTHSPKHEAGFNRLLTVLSLSVTSLAPSFLPLVSDWSPAPHC